MITSYVVIDSDGRPLAGGGGEYQEGAEKLGTAGLGTCQGGGGPQGVTDFLQFRETSGRRRGF